MRGGVTDPTITPFVLGMQAAGWMVEASGRCAVLGRCPRCQNSYLFCFLLDSARIKACPFCPHTESTQ